MPNNKKSSKTAKPKNYAVKILLNGPYFVTGSLPLKKEIIISDGKDTSLEWGNGDSFPCQESYALCRCGYSKNKPYCDSTHIEIGFDGTETAPQKNIFKNAEKTTGPDLILDDVEALCAAARFCHRAGGIWDLVEQPKIDDAKKTAIEEARDCPSGRLVVYDKKTKKALEPLLEPSISLIEDPEKKVSGPIWLKGDIPLQSSDGTSYEVRNRVTLCRCGGSGNKPFCDATHIELKFTDSDKSLKIKMTSK